MGGVPRKEIHIDTQHTSVMREKLICLNQSILILNNKSN